MENLMCKLPFFENIIGTVKLIRSLLSQIASYIHIESCVVVVVVCGRLTVPSFSWALTSLPGAEFSCSRARIQRRRLCVVCFVRCVWWPRVREVAPLDDSTAPRPCLVEGRQTTLCVCEVTLPKSWPGKIVYLRDLNRKWAARPSYVTWSKRSSHATMDIHDKRWLFSARPSRVTLLPQNW